MNYRTLIPTAWAFILCCGMALAAPNPPATRPAYHLGQADDKGLIELSGLTPSTRFPGVYWAHNDSGNPPELYAIEPAGHVLARYPVAGAPNVDWEDIATDEHGKIYVADMGNNNADRHETYVYRLAEPTEDPRTIPRQPDGQSGAAQKVLHPEASWKIRYPDDKPWDCESLVVHAGYAYVIPKLRSLALPTMYRFPVNNDGGRVVTLEKVCTFPTIRAPVTGADLSPDAKWLAVLTVLGPYAIEVDGDMTQAANAEPHHLTWIAPMLEACCWTNDGLLAGIEPGEMLLFRWEHFGIPRDPKKPE
jgi:hypothetical protein